VLTGIASLAFVLGAFQSPLTPRRNVPAAPSALIVGQVVDAGSGRPVAHAVVTISGVPNLRMTMEAGRVVSGGPPRVLTGSDGRFVFRDLPAGSFGLSATRPGYTPGGYGGRRPNGPSQQISLTDGERIGDATIPMWKQASISGRVVDEAGEPVVGTRVRAFARGNLPDPQRLTTAASTMTDDRGIYRLAMLDAREYVVGVVSVTPILPISLAREGSPALRFNPAGIDLATFRDADPRRGIQIGDNIVVLNAGAPVPPPHSGAMLIYPPLFHPAVSDPAQAVPIVIGAGEERAGVDIQIRPVPTVRVSGRLGGSVADIGLVPLRLVPATGTDVNIDGDTPGSITVADRTGAFAFEAVPMGEYLLRASTRVAGSGPGGMADLLYAEFPLTVGPTDIEGIPVVLRPGLRIAGSFAFEGSTPRPRRLSSVSLSIEPVGSLAAPLPRSSPRPTDEGEFEATGLPPGRYYVRVTGSPQGWMFKSATLNGRDVADTAVDLRNGDATGITITFSDRWSGLSGGVQTSAGAVDPEALVIAFPTDPQTWNSAGVDPRRIKAVRTSKSGQYNFTTLPPGDYYVAAVPDRQAADWRDVRFLEAASRGARQVSIGDGERKTQDLRTRGMK
jgi:hypothetical protein